MAVVHALPGVAGVPRAVQTRAPDLFLLVTALC